MPDLAHWGPILLAQMRRLPGFQDVNSDQQNGGLEEYVTYDRTTAARLGLTPSSLDGSLQRLWPGGSVGDLHPVEPVLRGARGSAAVLAISRRTQLHLSGRILHQWRHSDQAVITAAANTTPLQVNHTGVFPSVTVSFNLAPGLSLSDATLEISQLQTRLGMPSTIRGFFAGTLQAYQQSLSTEPILVTTALLAVYIVLGILYESLVHPLTIISTLPPASVGAMLALLVFKNDLNVISIIGIVLLIGLVKKNAIMMIDFALVAEREHGKSTTDAIFEACMLRFRPIMMTTMAALFGPFPWLSEPAPARS